MRRLSQRSPIAYCLLAALLFAGCRGREELTEVPPNETVAESVTDTVSTERDRRVATALKAKDALFKALSGRLMEVLQEDGPIAAINVCSQEASGIAASIGQEHGVEIGRTSFRLRNPSNAPRDWVQPLVEEHTETARTILLEDGSLGALYPIHLKVQCLMCHGGPDDILDEVKTEIAERYPQDKATGFRAGDLRGWFWVEVRE